jgi:hypothetical protein
MGLVAAPAQAAKLYVDNKLGEVATADRVAIAAPKPVQLVFEFQTDGVRNEKATKFAKPLALKSLGAMGYFSSVSETPVEGGSLLTVKINNIPEKGAAGKGFKVGLTFGLAGTAVTDFYDVTLQLSPAAGAAPLNADVKHAIITTLGKKSDTSYGTEYKKAAEAVEAMMRQAMDHGLNQMASDAGFPGK